MNFLAFVKWLCKKQESSTNVRKSIWAFTKTIQISHLGHKNENRHKIKKTMFLVLNRMELGITGFLVDDPTFRYLSLSAN